MNETEIEKESEIDALIRKINEKTLMLFNDDVNSFEHVIDCLMCYCNHRKEQAEQCALIVHSAGKCDIKHDSFDRLLPIYEALRDNQLKVEIQ